jgi:hypothetical protein
MPNRSTMFGGSLISLLALAAIIPVPGASAQSSQTAKSPRPLWAGTLLYGVYKSTDGGDHWVPASNGLPPHSGEGASANVSALAVSQSAPRIAYAAIKVSTSRDITRGQLGFSCTGRRTAGRAGGEGAGDFPQDHPSPQNHSING